MIRSVVYLAVAAILLAGCSSLKGYPPSGIDFTGTWRIVPRLSGHPETLPDIAHAPGKVLAELNSPRLQVQQGDGTCVIEYGDGHRQVYRWRDHKYAGWEGNDFVVRYAGPNEGQIERKFILSDGGKSLTVVTTLEMVGVTQFYKLEKEPTPVADIGQ